MNQETVKVKAMLDYCHVSTLMKRARQIRKVKKNISFETALILAIYAESKGFDLKKLEPHDVDERDSFIDLYDRYLASFGDNA